MVPNRVAPAALINLRWIVRLRWLAVAGQLCTIVIGARLVATPLPKTALLAVCSVVAAANLAVELWLRRGGRPADRTSGLNLLFDICALTALLGLSGGVSNPFSLLYLVHITIAAVILPAGWTLLLAGASAAAFSIMAGLFGTLPPLQLTGADTERTRIWGQWVAFVVAAAFISIFSFRMSRALRQREQELARSRADAEAAERLAALGTLAAGTAHELNTPLGTIAILAGELTDQLDGERRVEAQEIRKQVRRCKEIITSMLAPRGGAAEEEPHDVLLAPAVEAAVRRWREGRPGAWPQVSVDPGVAGAHARLPPRAFERALENLLENAFEATAGRSDRSLHVELKREGFGKLQLTVADNGVGVPEELQNRVGEPFFTTKGPGTGSGLGLYLARHVVERQGGGMQVISSEGRGTRVVLTMLET